MKTKQAEKCLKQIFEILNQHPSDSEFKVTKNWEKELKKIINFLLFFTADIKTENKEKINELNNIKRKIIEREKELKKLEKEEKVNNTKLKEIEENLSIVKNYIKVKKNLEKYKEIITLLKDDINLYNLIKNESGSFLSSMSDIDDKIEEVEIFITKYIEKSDNEKDMIFKSID